MKLHEIPNIKNIASHFIKLNEAKESAGIHQNSLYNQMIDEMDGMTYVINEIMGLTMGRKQLLNELQNLKKD